MSLYHYRQPHAMRALEAWKDQSGALLDIIHHCWLRWCDHVKPAYRLLDTPEDAAGWGTSFLHPKSILQDLGAGKFTESANITRPITNCETIGKYTCMSVIFYRQRHNTLLRSRRFHIRRFKRLLAGSSDQFYFNPSFETILGSHASCKHPSTPNQRLDNHLRNHFGNPRNL